MKIYVDTEFTGLHKNTTLISVGLVDDDGNTFYGEFTDYDKTQVNEWITENVIGKLYLEQPVSLDGQNVCVKGDSEFIKSELLKWLGNYDEVSFVIDVGHYDFVLLIDLLYGSGLAVPDNVSKAYLELNNDIALYKGLSITDAFDYSREEIFKEVREEQLPINKHNALYDAIIIRGIYHGLHDIS